MAIDVVLDHPHRIILRGPRRLARSVLGVLLLMVGIVATVPVVVLAIPALAFVGTVVDPQSIDPSLESMPLDILAVLWVASAAIAILGSVAGIRLLRGRRQLVLFLRRFGFDDATTAATFAAAGAIGTEWRLVTLDDEEVQPVGVPVATRRLVQVADAGDRLLSGTYRVGAAVLPRALQLVVIALFAIIAIDAINHYSGDSPDEFGLELLGSFQRLMEPVFAAWQAGGLQQPLGFDLPSAFIVLIAVVAVSILVTLILIPVLLLAIPLIAPFVFVTSAMGAVRAAEKSRRRVIGDHRQADLTAMSIARDSRGIFAARLVVLTVATAVWQHAVRRLAEVSSAIIIDVSEPTENLLWEVGELDDRFGERFVIVGEFSRVRALEEGPPPEPNSLAGRLAALLDGHKVLAYTTDRQGRARFSRALRNALESLGPSAVAMAAASGSAAANRRVAR